MKLSWLFVACLAVAVVGSSTLGAYGQTLPKPGPQHELIKQGEGTWDAVVKGPAGPEMKGTATGKMACGGLWMVSDFKMDRGGMEFHGHSLDGYDVDKKKYVSVWVDSMSTAPMFFEGDYNEASKTSTQTAKGKGPDGKPATFKSVLKMKDKDHHTFQMFIVGADGKEALMMTIEYSRKK